MPLQQLPDTGTAASATITPTVPSLRRACAIASTSVIADPAGDAQVELATVPSYRVRRGERRRDLRQQPGREIDHCARHPEAGHQLLDDGIGMAEVGQRLLPGAGRPRRGRLGKITEHGDRAGAGPSADRAQHHRRQVLCLVEDDVAEARRTLQQVGSLVDQDHVGERPASGAD